MLFFRCKITKSNVKITQNTKHYLENITYKENNDENDD